MPPWCKAQPVLERDEDTTSANINPPQRLPKKRGRPPKADDVAAATETADFKLSPAPAPSKRKRGQTITTNEDDMQAPKRARTEAPKTATTAKPATKLITKTSAQPIAKRDLPQWEGRNTHPGAIEGVGPAVRRSSQQVADDLHAIKKAAEEKLQKIYEAKAHLAEMQVSKDLEDEMLEMQVEGFIDELQAELGDSNDGEHFNFNISDAGSTDEEEEESKAGNEPVTKVCWLDLLLKWLSN